MSNKPLYSSSEDDNRDKNLISERYISWDLRKVITRISEGLNSNILATIQARLQISNHQLSYLFMVSPRTLDRRKKVNTLPPDKSERGFTIARLTDRAYEVFEDKDKVAQWFSKPHMHLATKRLSNLQKQNLVQSL